MVSKLGGVRGTLTRSIVHPETLAKSLTDYPPTLFRLADSSSLRNKLVIKLQACYRK